MRFSKNRQLDNIKQFGVNKFGLFILTSDLTIPEIPHIELANMGFDKISTTMSFVGDFLVVHDENGLEIVYDLKNNKIKFQHLDDKTLGYGFSPVGISGDRNLICIDEIDGEYKGFILNADTSVRTEISMEFDEVLDNGNILLRRQLDPPSISRVDLDGNALWKYNIEGTYKDPTRGDERPSELSRILGEHDQLLWLADFSNELYALDVKTGEKVFSCFDAGPANQFSIDKNDNRLVSLTSEYLRTVDLSSGEFKLSKIEMQEVFDKLEIRPDYSGRQFPVADTHLIFCDSFKSVVSTVELGKGKVDWFFDLFETRDYAMIKEMAYLSDKLYVLDNVGSLDTPVGSLHVFDRVS